MVAYDDVAGLFIMTKCDIGNGILDSLPRGEREALLPSLKRVALDAGETLYRPGDRVSSVYFPTKCVISTITAMRDGTVIEIAAVGREGVVGTHLIWGADRIPYQTLCQFGGDAYRIRSESFQAVLVRSRILRLLIQRHAQALYVSMGQYIACNGLHSLTQRCARWLLLTHDRLGTDEFPLTQDFLASMLGVNRQSVSVVASTFQKAGFIRYSRGYFMIIDRKGLKTLTCECYQVLADQYKRLPMVSRR